MNNIISLDSYREEIGVLDEDGTYHLCPVLMFENILKGKLKIKDLEDWELLMKAIIKDWLEYVRL